MKRRQRIHSIFFICAGLLIGCTDQTVYVNVTVTVSGPGSIVSDPPGIDCGSTCTAAFPASTVVSLKAQPQPGAKVESFGGPPACTGTQQCYFGLFSDVQASAQFATIPPSCSDGVKNGNESDLDCGGSCGPCQLDSRCAQASDCAVGQCVAGLCSACPLETNLLFNGDAESGVPADTAPGWTFSQGFTVQPYGAGNLASTDPGPQQRGQNFFAGGITASALLSFASTTIDVASCSRLAAEQKLTLRVEGWLGGFGAQDDNMTVQFGVRQGATMGNLVTLPPVLAAERGNVSGLVLRQGSVTLPPGTCCLDVLMTSSRRAGFSTDGYADNISAVLSLK